MNITSTLLLRSHSKIHFCRNSRIQNICIFGMYFPFFSDSDTFFQHPYFACSEMFYSYVNSCKNEPCCDCMLLLGIYSQLYGIAASYVPEQIECIAQIAALYTRISWKLHLLVLGRKRNQNYQTRQESLLLDAELLYSKTESTVRAVNLATLYIDYFLHSGYSYIAAITITIAMCPLLLLRQLRLCPAAVFTKYLKTLSSTSVYRRSCSLCSI